MTTPEGRVKAAIKRYLKTLPNCWFYMPVQNGMGVVGIPDGRFFAIECKAPGKEKNVTANQRATLDAIVAAGGIAFVASDVAETKKVLENVDPHQD